MELNLTKKREMEDKIEMGRTAKFVKNTFKPNVEVPKF